MWGAPSQNSCEVAAYSSHLVLCVHPGCMQDTQDWLDEKKIAMESGIDVARPIYSFPPSSTKKKKHRKRRASEMTVAPARNDQTKLPTTKTGTELEHTELGCKSANLDNANHTERPPPAKMLRLEEVGTAAGLAQGIGAPSPSGTNTRGDVGGDTSDPRGSTVEAGSPGCEKKPSASSTSDDEDMDSDTEGSDDDDGTITLAKCLRQFRSREQLDETDMWCVL